MSVWAHRRKPPTVAANFSSRGFLTCSPLALFFPVPFLEARGRENGYHGSRCGGFFTCRAGTEPVVTILCLGIVSAWITSVVADGFGYFSSFFVRVRLRGGSFQLSWGIVCTLAGLPMLLQGKVTETAVTFSPPTGATHSCWGPNSTNHQEVLIKTYLAQVITLLRWQEKWARDLFQEKIISRNLRSAAEISLVLLGLTDESDNPPWAPCSFMTTHIHCEKDIWTDPMPAYFDALLALFPSPRYHWNNNPLQYFKEASVEPLNAASFTQATACPLFPLLSLPG